MHRKPAWGLWLMVIIAPFVVFFVARRQQPTIYMIPESQIVRSKPAGMPFISVSDIDLDNWIGKGFRAVEYTAQNPTSLPITIDIEVVAGGSELSKTVDEKAELKDGSIARIVIAPDSKAIVTAFFMRMNTTTRVHLKIISPPKDGHRVADFIYG